MSRKDYWYEKEQLKIEMQQMGEDLCIHFYGGDRGHIGSVAMAEPRPSLTGRDILIIQQFIHRQP